MKLSTKQFVIFLIVMAIVVVGLLAIQHSVATTEAKDVAETASEQPEASHAAQVVIDRSRIDSDRDGLMDAEEIRLGTHPYLADTDRDGYEDALEVRFGYDPTGPGRPDLSVHIAAIDLAAPVTYPQSRTEEDVQEAMDRGVAYYPGTAFPGQSGNTYLTGHSSNYFWSTGQYNRVFRELRQLEVGDTFSIVQTQSTGHKINLNYQVYDIRVAENDDPSIWLPDREGSLTTLVTSWPIGSTRQRYVVRGLLITE